MVKLKIKKLHRVSAILTRWKSRVQVPDRPPLNKNRRLGDFRGRLFSQKLLEKSQQNRNKILIRTVVGIVFLFLILPGQGLADENKPAQWIKDYFTYDCKAIHIPEQPGLLLTLDFKGWDKPSQWIGGGYVLFQAIDYLQTRTILKDDHWTESNQVIQQLYDGLGEIGVLGYFIGVTGFNLWLADKLPPWGRSIYLFIDLASASDTVRWNYTRCGVRIRF